jgi:hypothetical protein
VERKRVEVEVEFFFFVGEQKLFWKSLLSFSRISSRSPLLLLQPLSSPPRVNAQSLVLDCTYKLVRLARKRIVQSKKKQEAIKSRKKHPDRIKIQIQTMTTAETFAWEVGCKVKLELHGEKVRERNIDLGQADRKN